MKRRWLLRLGLFAGLALFGFWFVLWLTAPEHRINEWRARQIKRGMTLDEVTTLLNAPAGRYLSKLLTNNEQAELDLAQIRVEHATRAELLMELAEKKASGLVDIREVHEFAGDSRFESWVTDGFAVFVLFDPEQKVLQMRAVRLDIGDSLLLRIRRLMRLS